MIDHLFSGRSQPVPTLLTETGLRHANAGRIAADRRKIGDGGLFDMLLDHVGCGKELILSLISTIFSPLEKILTDFFMPLVCPKRCKGAHGGGGGAKSHFFGGVLIRLCAYARRRAICIREVQDSISESVRDSISDSVRRLLIDKITKFGLGASFSVLDSEIRGQSGSHIVFKGMQSCNSVNIKPLEG